MAGDWQKREIWAGEETRQVSPSCPCLSFFPPSHTPTPAQAQPWNPSSCCSCLCRAHRHSFPSHSVRPFSSLSFFVSFDPTSISSFPTHSFNRHTVNHSLHGPPCSAYTCEGNNRRRAVTHSSRQHVKVRFRQSHSFRSSALPVFCFLVSGPGLSFSLLPHNIWYCTNTDTDQFSRPFTSLSCPSSPYLAPRRSISFRIPHQAFLTRRPATRPIPRSQTAYPFHQELRRKGLFPPGTHQCHLRSKTKRETVGY